ncbi:hypothetical protein HOY34_04365 [Xinfangfangia sp. D13-10-4-6]|uniref:H-type lectin domain-containing protein n=1 Tax=Pseudogemmobacter hezensis TaxID=2737662 RepID=UPI0015557F4C|nr:H-type lectin domain-containing protein [Pseudogemmobacter hezensis]NPD14432.1 hypothetical protein [Pseudogemmobacter hezensis]
MRRLTSPIGMQQGSELLFSDFENDGPMWAGDGPRETRHRIEFATPFLAPPAVMLSLSMWDMDKGTNSRVDISSDTVTGAGFWIVFRTWGDSRIARVRADWTAIGSLPDEETWDVP